MSDDLQMPWKDKGNLIPEECDEVLIVEVTIFFCSLAMLVAMFKKQRMPQSRRRYAWEEQINFKNI